MKTQSHKKTERQRDSRKRDRWTNRHINTESKRHKVEETWLERKKGIERQKTKEAEREIMINR